MSTKPTFSTPELVAECNAAKREAVRLRKVLRDLLPFVLDDYHPTCATAEFAMAVEAAQLAIADKRRKYAEVTVGIVELENERLKAAVRRAEKIIGDYCVEGWRTIAALEWLSENGENKSMSGGANAP